MYPKIVAYLKRLTVEIERYNNFDPERAEYCNFDPGSAANINYEDVYYAATQIHDSLLGEYDNPIVQPFVDKILPDIKPLLVWEVNGIRKEWRLIKMASVATNYIHDVVRSFWPKNQPIWIICGA